MMKKRRTAADIIRGLETQLAEAKRELSRCDAMLVLTQERLSRASVRIQKLTGQMTVDRKGM